MKQPNPNSRLHARTQKLMTATALKMGTSLLAALQIVGAVGCAGTQFSRGYSGYDRFGKWPYQAVAIDCYAAKDTFKGCLGDDPTMYPVFGLLGLVSMPVDICLDTILLPCDLILWPLGYQKCTNLRMPF